MEHILWTEKYRPQTIEDCILPDRLKKPFQEYVNQKEIPNLILSGGPGVGKTTVAKAMCNEIGCDYIVINGSDESGIDTFRVKIKGFASAMSFTGNRKVIIIDEADYLNPNSTQPALRNAIEEFAKNCSFIFTCNYKQRIIDPLHSRCSVIDFNLSSTEKAEMAGKFFGRIKTILTDEEVSYEQKIVAEVVKKHFPDFRRVINELQRYSKYGEINEGILAQVSNVKLAEIIKHVANKDFGSLRKWAATNDTDPNTIFRSIYDNMYDVLKPSSIPKAVIILADYQYKNAFVADPEINMVACLTELMVECEFV
jgi:DNA polymerase III delta prime subunit